MPFAQSRGAKIHYEVTGEGNQTLLLLMGLGGHASEWGPVFVEALERRFRVVRLDNRGIGESVSERDRWSMQDMAQDACAVLDALGVGSACVAGTSMGGMIAQTVALAHPRRVARLVLMSTGAGGAQAAPPRPEALALFAPAHGVSVAELRRRAVTTLTAPGFVQRHPEVVERLVRLRVAVPTSGRTFYTQLQAIGGSDRSERVREISCPTLVVHGEDDVLVPVDNGKWLAANIPGARLVLLPDCGHLPHDEQPDALAEAIIDFAG